MDWLNYHHLMNFWLVAREGSVQRASEVLHVTPASVSIQIKQLERAIGNRLFRKQGRGLVLTGLGEQVAAYADEIFATGRELIELVRGQAGGRPLELRVGIRDVMPKLLAYQLLEPALELDQPVKLVCQEGEMSQLVAELAIHKLDVILSDRALDPLYKVQAYSHRLAESEISIVGTKSLARKHGKDFPASLDGAPFLLPTTNSVLRRQLDQWFSDIDVTPQVRGEFADSAMLKIAGVNGLGLFALPTSVLSDAMHYYDLQSVGNATGVKEQYYAVSAERRIRHPAVLAMLNKRV
jgi:LysR family transcriptional activator of nhaA